MAKTVQTPSLLVVLFEDTGGFRQIFLDGRPHPPDPDPSWVGHSIGKWDGDTLVVETTGLRDGGWLDIWGSPFTDAAKITERFRRPNYGHLRASRHLRGCGDVRQAMASDAQLGAGAGGGSGRVCL
jgi:hypothetical protein